MTAQTPLSRILEPRDQPESGAPRDRVDRSESIEAIRENGRLSTSYLLMCGLSAGIASLGLLLSSPAVIIGAMLVSPLMGPIILLGFAFWMVDWKHTQRAMLSLAAGCGLAFLVALSLTLISPLKEATPEILARTRPNLFDLLVAVLSGVAGGYAVVRHKGETVIGVAIATALMPPIATAGFGVGVGDIRLSGGAFLLFFTNLIAIALSAAGVAAAYRFRSAGLFDKSHMVRWRGVAVALVVALLCIPLTRTLTNIAWEARATSFARRSVETLFGDNASITALSVAKHGRSGSVTLLVATPTFVDNAGERLGDTLEEALGTDVNVKLDQVVLADPAALRAARQTAAPALPAPDPALTAVRQVSAAIPFETETVAVDPERKRILVRLAEPSALGIEGVRALELALRQKFPEWAIEVTPPLAPLAALPLSAGEAGPVVNGQAETAAWALARWGPIGPQATLCLGRRAGMERAAAEAALAAKGLRMAAPTGGACSGLGQTAAEVRFMRR